MKNYCQDLLEAIALQDTAISHILNAEGEKIQLAVQRNECICDLLSINASVAGTIEDVMWLELVSYHKMKALLACGCCEEKDLPCGRCGGRCGDCTPKGSVFVEGFVFHESGSPCSAGVVSCLSGNIPSSCKIGSDGNYKVQLVPKDDTIIVNAIGAEGKTDSFIIRKPFLDAYRIDMFL